MIKLLPSRRKRRKRERVEKERKRLLSLTPSYYCENKNQTPKVEIVLKT